MSRAKTATLYQRDLQTVGLFEILSFTYIFTIISCKEVDYNFLIFMI